MDTVDRVEVDTVLDNVQVRSKLEFQNKEEARVWMYTASTTASRVRAVGHLGNQEAVTVGTTMADLLTLEQRSRTRKTPPPTPKPAAQNEGENDGHQ